MLSATSDHAIRAILVLARLRGDRPIRADEVADAIGAPRNYLAKTLNTLAKRGIVTSTRGPSGGFHLATPPSELTLARIVDCFDEPRPQVKCLLGTSRCDPTHPCAAHVCWAEITRARRAPLAGTTVADLLGAAAASPANAEVSPTA